MSVSVRLRGNGLRLIEITKLQDTCLRQAGNNQTMTNSQIPTSKQKINTRLVIDY
jgi:hypothetical protein